MLSVRCSLAVELWHFWGDGHDHSNDSQFFTNFVLRAVLKIPFFLVIYIEFTHLS